MTADCILPFLIMPKALEQEIIERKCYSFTEILVRYYFSDKIYDTADKYTLDSNNHKNTIYMYWVGKDVSSLFLKKFKDRFHAGLIYKP